MIKASLILAAAFCMTALLRRRAAAERHMVWAASIVSAALLPVFSLLLPPWEPALAHRVAAALPPIRSAAADSNRPTLADVRFRAAAVEPGMFARMWPSIWLGGSMAGLLLIGIRTAQRGRLSRVSVALSDPVVVKITADLASQDSYPRKIYLR